MSDTSERSISGSAPYLTAQSRFSWQTPITPPPPGVHFFPNPMQTTEVYQNKGMTPLFQSLTNSDSVIKRDFDFEKGFKRAVKVFIMSYPEIVDSIPLTHSRKLQEFINEMETLYNIRADIPLTQMFKKARKKKYTILITFKRLVGRDRLSNPQLVSTFKDKEYKQRIDTQNEEQPYAPLKINVKFDTFVKLRSDANRRIVLTIEEDNSAQPQQEELKPFDLIIANTHPEGFEDWIDFGRGVRLLISVTYRLKNRFKQSFFTYHMKTIELMLKNRLNANLTTNWGTHFKHQESAMKYDVSYRQRYVDPKNETFFWTKPDISPQNSQTVVKFNDMQIGFKTNDNFEESVCLCNEWCNWNAFFYYNPIYRFLLVRHHQIYMKNMSNIPDMYLCLTVLSSCGAGPLVITPLFRLMSCANDYRKRYYDNYYLKNYKTFRNLYEKSEPSPPILNALTYNKLMYELDVTELCHFSDPNPFSDICVENLIHYYNVLIDIHRSVSSFDILVVNPREWAKEIDSIGRNKYNEYIKRSYDKCIAQDLFDYDYLFTIDYEYASKLSQNIATQKIMEIRDHIMCISLADNPFNISLTLNPFLTTFASIYKFLAKVDPILPVAHKQEALSMLKSCYIQMDTDFDDFFNTNMTFDFQIDRKPNVFSHLKQNFEVFYTLKVYFYAFEIQKHCINSVLKANKKINHKTEQLCEMFEFIWKNSTIEQKYRNSYPGEVLFESHDFLPFFEHFYRQFWGSAQHETINLMSLANNIQSAHFEYQRLYYWLGNNGNNKRIFVKIIDSLDDCVFDIKTRAQEIFNVKILEALQRLPSSYPYSAEVFDQLVYYLVKAICSVTLSTVALFLQPMHSLQTSDLVSDSISYSLCKPGWIPLFKTVDTLLSALDDLKTILILYDDEFNRISDTCLLTKQMIKNIYRQFYSKLAFEWLDELNTCYSERCTSTEMSEFFVLHLSVGLSFIAVFCDTFRYDFAKYRKSMFRALRGRISPVELANTENPIQMAKCIDTVQIYLQNKQLMDAASPFLRDPWRSHLSQVLKKFEAMTGEQLGIDLSAATHFVF